MRVEAWIRAIKARGEGEVVSEGGAGLVGAGVRDGFVVFDLGPSGGEVDQRGNSSCRKCLGF